MALTRTNLTHAAIGILLLVSLLSGVPGCSGTKVVAGDGDGGGEPAEDGFDGEDGVWPYDGEMSDGDGETIVDRDPGEDFGLLVPAGTQVCGDTWYTDIFEVYRTRGRVTLKEGVFRLPRDQVSFQLELIEKLEFGPDRDILIPTGPGTFTRYIEGTEIDGSYRYEYLQVFDRGGERYEFVYNVQFKIEGGVAIEPLLVFDEEYISRFDGYHSFNMKGYFPFRQRFSTCIGSRFRGINHEVSLANGDLLQIEQRMQKLDDGYACMYHCQALMVRAVFERGTELREVTDTFRLAYKDIQHNWIQEYLVVFDQPVDEIYGVYMAEERAAQQTAEVVYYLDVGLNVIDSVNVSSYQFTYEETCEGPADCPEGQSCRPIMIGYELTGWCFANEGRDPVGTACDEANDTCEVFCIDTLCTEWCTLNEDCPEGMGCESSDFCIIEPCDDPENMATATVCLESR